MKVGVIILIVLGVLLAVLGFAVNSTPDAQLLSFIAGKGTDPGTPLIIIGILLIAGGIALVVFAGKKKKKD